MTLRYLGTKIGEVFKIWSNLAQTTITTLGLTKVGNTFAENYQSSGHNIDPGNVRLLDFVLG
jgi:hypothetical protein